MTLGADRGAEVFADVDETDQDELVAWVQANAPSTDELPAEISDDVAKFLAGLDNPANGAEPTLDQQEAEQRLLDWEESNCTS